MWASSDGGNGSGIQARQDVRGHDDAGTAHTGVREGKERAEMVVRSYDYEQEARGMGGGILGEFEGASMTLSDPSAIWFGIDETAPGPGMVLVLNYHHDGESHWCSPEQAVVRIESILDGLKPKKEWGPRMEAMRIVPFGKWRMSEACSEAWAAYAKACFKAWAAYDKAYSEAGAVCNKARSEAGAIEYPAEAWAAEWKEARLGMKGDRQEGSP